MNASVFELRSPTAGRSRVRRGGWSWGPVEGARLRVLSLGAGVQSSTVALMAAHGAIGPMPDAMIFSDTGEERAATMAHLAWLEGEVTRRSNGRIQCLRTGREDRLSNRIRARSKSLETRTASDRFVTAPFFVLGRGKVGQGKRQCTREFKVEPLERLQRTMLGFKPRQRIPAGMCEVWIGISKDEVVRAGAAYSAWVVHRYPLLELGMSRRDCECWLVEHGYPVPVKSACIFCPYKTNEEWRQLRDDDPEAWAVAIEIDRLIRDTPGMRQQEFVHRSCVPLHEVDLSTAEERGQGMLMVCDAGCGL